MYSLTCRSCPCDDIVESIILYQSHLASMLASSQYPQLGMFGVGTTRRVLLAQIQDPPDSLPHLIKALRGLRNNVKISYFDYFMGPSFGAAIANLTRLQG